MAGDTNKIQELVSADDDDATAELEMPTFAQVDDSSEDSELDQRTYEVDESVRDQDTARTLTALESDLRDRTETISRLQFDIEQLRSKWLGLEAEINAREAQTVDLNNKVEELQGALGRRGKKLRKRDKQIARLKKTVQKRTAEFEKLQDEYGDFQARYEQERARWHEPIQPHADGADPAERIEQLEHYGDELRSKLQDLLDERDKTVREHDAALAKAEKMRAEADARAGEAVEERERAAALQESLDAVESKHAEEIRTLRFELGTAQDTATENENLNGQLASDLLEARSAKETLEQGIADVQAVADEEIAALEKRIRLLEQDKESLNQKLDTKNEAVNALLTELARKSEKLEAIGDIEDVIHDIDDRISERLDKASRNPAERMTRLLVGTIDGQMLRFPLFKDRLTIGRTDNNDIQLKAAYISRKHAVLQTDGDLTRIIDWGSKNGVMVNGERITEHFLQHGDMVTVGNARFRYEERKKRDS